MTPGPDARGERAAAIERGGKLDRVMDLLDETLALPREERAAHLDSACAGDAALRAEVESLLAASEGAGDFLGSPACILPTHLGLGAEGAEPSIAGGSLGHYQLGERLGSGGMGVVYAAHDLRLDRPVALKVVARSWADDPDRRARFEREARALAAVNHPHIAAVYGLEPVGPRGEPVIVMELVPGRSLADVIGDGPLDWPEAARIAAQIADALDAAHARGIVHRDLKPANVHITPEGRAKVLDFGLAKDLARPVTAAAGSKSPGSGTRAAAAVLSPSPLRPASPSSHASAAPSPLVTNAGAVMGTPAYMSPEQARGRAIDRRTDIWALGCVLYEMLAARRAFGGATATETVSSILRAEPDLAAIPAGVPPALLRIISRCLTKDPERRLRDAGDARLELEDILAGVAEDGPAAPRASRAWRWATAGAAVLAAGAAAALFSRRGPVPNGDAAPPEPIRTVLNLPAGRVLNPLPHQVAVSPDGRAIAFATGAGPTGRLWLQRVDEFQPREVVGSADATHPFFSEDGRWLAFSGEGRLMKAPVDGGPATPAAMCNSGFSAHWLADGTVLWSRRDDRRQHILRPGATVPEPLDVRDASGPSFHVTDVLPDGVTLLVTVVELAPTQDAARIESYHMPSGERRALVPEAANARYLRSGHLVYTQAGNILGVRFDPDSLETRGEPAVLVEGVATHGYRWPMYGGDISPSGTLVYVPGPVRTENSELSWVDRSGRVTTIRSLPRGINHPRISPDGRTAVVVGLGDSYDVALYDLHNPAASPQNLTTGRQAGMPHWSPDGSMVAYSDFGTDERGGICVVRTDGTGRATRLHAPPEGVFLRVWGWTADGTAVSIREEWTDATGPHSRLLLLPHDGGPPRPIPLPEIEVLGAVFSPDGRWVAYVSGDSGTMEVYLRSWPDLGPRRKVSVSGGYRPAWRADTGELFYQYSGSIWAVPFTGEPGRETGEPVLLFENLIDDRYDVDAAGERFLVSLHKGATEPVTRLNVVHHWDTEVRRRLP